MENTPPPVITGDWIERRSSDERYKWALVVAVLRRGWITVSHLQGDSLVESELIWKDGMWVKSNDYCYGRAVKDCYGLMKAGLICGPPKKLEDGTVVRELDDGPVIWRVPEQLQQKSPDQFDELYE